MKGAEVVVDMVINREMFGHLGENQVHGLCDSASGLRQVKNMCSLSCDHRMLLLNVLLTSNVIQADLAFSIQIHMDRANKTGDAAGLWP